MTDSAVHPDGLVFYTSPASTGRSRPRCGLLAHSRGPSAARPGPPGPWLQSPRPRKSASRSPGPLLAVHSLPRPPPLLCATVTVHVRDKAHPTGSDARNGNRFLAPSRTDAVLRANSANRSTTSSLSPWTPIFQGFASGDAWSPFAASPPRCKGPPPQPGPIPAPSLARTRGCMGPRCVSPIPKRAMGPCSPAPQHDSAAWDRRSTRLHRRNKVLAKDNTQASAGNSKLDEQPGACNQGSALCASWPRMGRIWTPNPGGWGQ